MFRLKSIGIAVPIICSLCLIGLVHHSDAASVTSMSIYSGDDSGSGSTASVVLTTDEDILLIDWYIDDKYSFTSFHGNTQSVYEYLGTFDGDIKGIKYDVRAVVSFVESSDADGSSTFSVYKPKSIYGHKRTGVYGSVTLSSHYHDGSGIVMVGSAYAYNGTDEDCKVSSFFRHTRMDAGGFQKQDPEPVNNILPAPEDLPVGGFYSDSGDSSYLRFPVPGGIIEEGDSYTLDAHVHLQVSGGGKTDVWHDANGAWTHTFSHTDDASYEGD